MVVFTGTTYEEAAHLHSWVCLKATSTWKQQSSHPSGVILRKLPPTGISCKTPLGVIMSRTCF